MILICIWKVSAEPVTVVCIHKLPHHMWRAQVFCGNNDCQLPILPATNFLGGKTQRGLGGGRLWSRRGKSVTGETEEVEVDRCLTTIHVLFHGSGVGGGRSVQGQRWPSHACTFLLLLLLHRPCLSRCWHAKCQQISAPCPACAQHCTLTQFDF